MNGSMTGSKANLAQFIQSMKKIEQQASLKGSPRADAPNNVAAPNNGLLKLPLRHQMTRNEKSNQITTNLLIGDNANVNRQFQRNNSQNSQGIRFCYNQIISRGREKSERSRRDSKAPVEDSH